MQLGEHLITEFHLAIDYENPNTDILVLLSEGQFIPALSLRIQARDLLYVQQDQAVLGPSLLLRCSYIYFTVNFPVSNWSNLLLFPFRLSCVQNEKMSFLHAN